MTYLLTKLIATAFDDIAFKLEPKPRLASSLINGLSTQKPIHVASSEILERVKLITSVVIKNQSTQLQLKLAPDLLNLSLLTMLQEAVGVD